MGLLKPLCVEKFSKISVNVRSCRSVYYFDQRFFAQPRGLNLTFFKTMNHLVAIYTILSGIFAYVLVNGKFSFWSKNLDFLAV